MQTSTFTILKPSEGFYLTQAVLKPHTERIFSKEIYVGANDTPANYIEVDEAEKARLESIEQERIERDMREAEERARMSNPVDDQ